MFYCIEAELIKQADCANTGGIIIADLTVAGHELIGNIREKDVWERLKSVFPKVGALGLSALSDVAHSLAVSLALNVLHIQQ